MRLDDVLAQKGRHVFTAQPEDSVLDAVRQLNAHNIGALAVVDGSGRLVGMITERDILRLIGRVPCKLDAERVGDYMTQEVITADCADDIDRSLAVMTAHRIRHLPVVRQGRLEGMVSQGDLVKARLDDSLFEARQLTNFVTGRYPA